MDIFTALNNQWGYVLSLLPEDLDRTSFSHGAILRRRGIKSASALLRVAFAYAWGQLSLRGTAAWAETIEIADISDVAILERLRNAADWLGYLLTWYLRERTKANLKPTKGLRVRIADATSIARRGSKGTDWRVHLGLDLQRLRCDNVVLTGPKIGESLTNLNIEAGEVVVGDRLYARRRDVYTVVSAGAHVILRLTVNNMPLEHPDGGKLKIVDVIKDLKPGEILDIPVRTKGDPKQGIPDIPGRMIATRLDPKDAEKARTRLLRDRKKKGKKPTAGSLLACEFLILFTTLGQEVKAEDIIELYLFRWQVELSFKRMKSLLNIDDMAAKDERLCRAYILSKLLAVLIVEDHIDQMGTFPPCGRRSRPGRARAGQERARQTGLAPV